MVENGTKHRQNSHLIIHCPTSKGVSEVSEQANEWAVRANERTDEQVVQYFHLYSFLFLTIVYRLKVCNHGLLFWTIAPVLIVADCIRCTVSRKWATRRRIWFWAWRWFLATIGVTFANPRMSPSWLMAPSSWPTDTATAASSASNPTARSKSSGDSRRLARVCSHRPWPSPYRMGWPSPKN